MSQGCVLHFPPRVLTSRVYHYRIIGFGAISNDLHLLNSFSTSALCANSLFGTLAPSKVQLSRIILQPECSERKNQLLHMSGEQVGVYIAPRSSNSNKPSRLGALHNSISLLFACEIWVALSSLQLIPPMISFSQLPWRCHSHIRIRVIFTLILNIFWTNPDPHQFYEIHVTEIDFNFHFIVHIHSS